MERETHQKKYDSDLWMKCGLTTTLLRLHRLSLDSSCDLSSALNSPHNVNDDGGEHIKNRASFCLRLDLCLNYESKVMGW